MSNDRPMPWWSASLSGAVLSLVFAALSWKTVSVGWILCCAVAVVSAIASLLLAFLSKRMRVSALLGAALSIASLLWVFYSYKHIAAVHGL